MLTTRWRALLLAIIASLALTSLALANGTDLLPAGACGANEIADLGDAGGVDVEGLLWDGCYGIDPDSGETVFIWAYQDPTQSGQEFMDDLSTSIAGGVSFFTPLTLAGRSVISYGPPGGAETYYFFNIGDTVYWIQASTEAEAERAVQRIGSGGGGGSGSGGAAFTESVPDPTTISVDPIVIATSVAAAAGIAVAAPFPSALFNSTLEANYDEVSGWFRRLRRRVSGAGSALGARFGAFFATRRGLAAFIGIAAVMYGFLNPGFGLNLESGAIVIGSWVGIVALIAVDQLPPRVYTRRRLGEPGKLRIHMAGLLIGLGCVVVTRLTDFQPGYLYGVVVAYTFSRTLNPIQAGKASALGAASSLALAFGAFVALGAVRAPFDGSPPLWALPVVAALVVMVIGGIEDVLFGLLPMRYMPGREIMAWNKPVWVLLFGASAFAFLHILVNPSSGYLSDTTLQPLGKVIALFVGFGLVSVLFWAFFRYRKPRTDEPAEPAAAMLHVTTPDSEEPDR